MKLQARKRKRGTDQNWKRTQVSVRSMVLRIRSMCNISSVPLPESRLGGTLMLTFACTRRPTYACARVDSSKVGRWSVPRLETMRSQEVFRQVPEHTNPIRRTKFAIQGGGFCPKYYRVSRHLLPSMCTFLWQLFYDCLGEFIINFLRL